MNVSILPASLAVMPNPLVPGEPPPARTRVMPSHPLPAAVFFPLLPASGANPKESMTWLIFHCWNRLPAR